MKFKNYVMNSQQARVSLISMEFQKKGIIDA